MRFGGRLSDRGAVVAFVLVVAVFAAGSFWWIYGSELAHGPPIRADGTGYYLYLPAVLLGEDVTMERIAERSFEGRTSEWGSGAFRRTIATSTSFRSARR